MVWNVLYISIGKYSKENLHKYIDSFEIKISDNNKSKFKILHIGLFNQNNKTNGRFELSVSCNFTELYNATFKKAALEIWFNR